MGVKNIQNMYMLTEKSVCSHLKYIMLCSFVNVKQMVVLMMT